MQHFRIQTQLGPNTHCILDGFPLDKYQAEALDELIQPVDRVFVINASSDTCKARFSHEVNATTTLRAVLTPDRRRWQSSSGRLQSAGPRTPVDPSTSPRRRLQSESASSYTESEAGPVFDITNGPQTPTASLAPSDADAAARASVQATATEDLASGLSPVPPDISGLWLTSIEYDSQDEESELPPLERSIGHIKSLHLLRGVVDQKAQKLHRERGRGQGSGRREHRRLASEPAKRPSRLHKSEADDGSHHRFDEVRGQACFPLRSPTFRTPVLLTIYRSMRPLKDSFVRTS